MEKNKEGSLNKESFEIEFFERLVRENPDFVDALIPLAEAYTRAGDFDKGLSVDKRLSQLRPDDAIVHYNLACSFSLTGKIPEAIEMLKKAVNLGYDDFDYMNVDEDLKNVRKNNRYKEIFNIWKERKRG